MLEQDSVENGEKPNTDPSISKAAPDELRLRVEMLVQVLMRDPVLANISASIAEEVQALTEFVIFIENRAIVLVNSTEDGHSQPRRLTSNESKLLSRIHTEVPACEPGASLEHSSLTASDKHTTVYGFPNSKGEVLGAITIHSGQVDFQAIKHLLRAAFSVALREISRPRSDFYRESLESLEEAIILLDSKDFSIAWANRAVATVLGYTPIELARRSAVDFIHPDDVEFSVGSLIRTAEHLEVNPRRTRLRHRDGSWIDVHVNGTNQQHNPAIGGILLSLRGSEQYRNSSSPLDYSPHVANSILATLSDGVIVSDEFGAVTLVNEAARTQFGYFDKRSSATFDRSDFTVYGYSGESSQPKTVNELVRQSSEQTAAFKGTVVDNDGSIRHLVMRETVVASPTGELLGSVATTTDVTNEYVNSERLRLQAFYDQLTSLPNRRMLEEHLEELKNQKVETVSACFIDLDAFKLVNDRHGHQVGDELIRGCSRRISSMLSNSDLLARHGGDEFVVLFPRLDLSSARRRCEAILNALCVPFEVSGLRFEVTASIGIATANPGSEDFDMLLRHADVAMYEAKRRGRNRIEVYGDRLAKAASVHESHRKLLRDALANRTLEMHFQPIFDNQTERVIGFESLARLRTESGTYLPPAAFLESLEATAMIWDLDRAAFELTCQAATSLLKFEGVEKISCNFGSISLTHPDLEVVLAQTVERHGIRPDQIVIEITESAALDLEAIDPDRLPRLVEAGFELVLDDFGTGYSSLSHLRELPISAIKIDKSFVARLRGSGTDRFIAQAIVELAKQLGLLTTAEGVEQRDQLVLTRELCVDHVQGWLFAKALPLAECEHRLASEWNKPLQAQVV